MNAGKPADRLSIADLQPGQRVEEEVYRVAQKDLRTTSNGSLYIHAVFADATGEMLARMWNATQEIYDTIPDGGLLHVRGRVESYKGNRQFIIDGLRAVEPGSVDPSAFLPSTSEDVDALWDEVLAVLRTVKDRHVLALIGTFVNDEAFVTRFKRAPAAVQMHHAYLGGLVEHTRNLLKLADVVCPLYPKISRDLVVAGVLLHDAGKTAELGYEGNLEYTSEGQLVGHIVQCTIWLHERCRAVEAEMGEPFPAQLEYVLKHIILAHHGKYEFGSPRLPAIPEAFVVHYLDNLDAKVAMTLSAIENDPDAESDWTSYVRALETRVYKPDVLNIRGDTTSTS
jgi:3'-5' exoribonuclease